MIAAFRPALTGLLLAIVSALADELPQTKAEFSADFHISAQTPVGPQEMAGKLYSAPGKERREVAGPGGSTQTTIMRADKSVVWLLLPDNQNLETPITTPPTGTVGLPQVGKAPDVKIREIGKEPVNGVAATKHEMEMKMDEAGTLNAFVWLGPEDIQLRMQGKVAQHGQTFSFNNELTNLKIGKQEGALFELSSGARKADSKALPVPGSPSPAAPPPSGP
jgi:outer membrane lipoprotein-sorting protein